MSHRSSSPVSTCSQRSNSSLSVSQIAAADYIGEVAVELATVAALSRLPLIHYLLCIVWAETHDIVRHTKAAENEIAGSQCVRPTDIEL
jgi:hypothetical protein